MQLYEVGKLDLNTDIQTYLPEGFFEKIDYKPITIINLFNHQAGFGDNISNLFVYEVSDDYSLESSLKDLLVEQVYEPGTITAYSNFSTALAGLIVERISGIEFYNYVHKNIFESIIILLVYAFLGITGIYSLSTLVLGGTFNLFSNLKKKSRRQDMKSSHPHDRANYLGCLLLFTPILMMVLAIIMMATYYLGLPIKILYILLNLNLLINLVLGLYLLTKKGKIGVEKRIKAKYVLT